MVRQSSEESFRCSLCERHREVRFLSTSVVVTSGGAEHPICKQCDGFVALGLPFVTNKLGNRKVRAARDSSAAALPSRISSVAENTEPRSQNTAETRVGRQSVAPAGPPVREPPAKRRLASATEVAAFTYQSLSLSRYIDGFIKGLEAAGLDRGELEPEAARAINILLGICQELASDRRNVKSGRERRSEVRKLTRHIKETEMMVDEYIRAVSEACEQNVARKRV